MQRTRKAISGVVLIAAVAFNHPLSAEGMADRKSKPVEVRLFGYDIPVSARKTVILRDPDSPLQIQSFARSGSPMPRSCRSHRWGPGRDSDPAASPPKAIR